MSPAKASAYTVGLGILLGMIATVFIYGQALGLGFALFVAILLGGLLLQARIHRFRPISRSLILIAPMLFFAVMIVIRAEWTLTMFNLAAATGLALLLVYFFNSSGLEQQNIFGYGIRALTAGFEVWFRPFREIWQARKWITVRQWGSLGPVARGAVITVPVVAVFVILLSSADEVFARLVDKIVNALIPHTSFELFYQVGFTALFAWMAIGGLAFAVADRKAKRPPTPGRASDPGDPFEESSEQPAQAPAAPPFSLGFTETMMLLVSVCAVFIAFVAIQFVYLFGGARNIDNFSYADYVHRGFLELVLVACLTLGMILMLNTISIRKTRRHVDFFRGASTLLIVLTGVILISAFQRLRLYEITYGFTTLRLLIYVFIGWLGFLFVGFTVSLYWTPPAINVFGVTSLIAVIGFVATLDVLNPDALIAWQNVKRGDIDPLYLASLSEEAVPALVTLVNAPEPGLRAIVRDALRIHAARLADESDWRAFNVGRTAARAALASVQIPPSDSNQVIGPYINVADIKAFARKGQSTRDITRQFGMPVGGDTYFESANYAEIGADSRDNTPRYFTMMYWTKLGETDSSVQFRFDMRGLQQVCILDTTAHDYNCDTVPLS